MSESQSAFASPLRPERMYRKGRLTDQEFDADERLYFRVRPEHIDGNHVNVEGIKFPDFSVNRSRYSQPEDVTFGLSDVAIAQFQVQHIPEPMTPPDGGAYYEFRAEHDPIDDVGQENFAHAEVRTFKNQLERAIKCFDRSLSPAKTVKLKFRQILADKVRPYAGIAGL